jgi:hypothetical protein
LIVGALQEFTAFLILHIILATTAIALLFIHRLHRYGPNLALICWWRSIFPAFS